MLDGRCHCGATGWRHAGAPPSATVCNCSICRRMGTVWAYGILDDEITLDEGPQGLRRYVWGDGDLAFLSCPVCANVLAWVSHGTYAQSRRAAVNLRLADPGTVRQIPLKRFDGADSWQAQPMDGRCVADLWI